MKTIVRGTRKQSCSRTSAIRWGVVLASLLASIAGLLVKPSAANANDKAGLVDQVTTLGRPIDWQTPGSNPNNWRVYSTYQPFRFGMTQDGIVMLTGMMAGCPDATEPIFVLPSAYRPAGRHIFSVPAAKGKPGQNQHGIAIGHIYIFRDGRVIYYSFQPWGAHACDLENAESRNWISLSGIMFPSAASLGAEGP